MKCPHCGNNNPEGVRFCNSCGKEIIPKLGSGDSFLYPHKKEELIPQELKTLAYLFAFIIPFIGIFVGIRLMKKSNQEYRQLGIQCVIISGILIIIILIFITIQIFSY